MVKHPLGALAPPGRKPSLRRWRGRLARSPVLDLLLLVTLFQGVVPVFTAPMVVSGAAGETVVLCSVQGRQLVALGPGEPLPPDHDEPCPACLLQHHLAGALPTAAPALAPPRPALMARRSDLPPETAARAYPGPVPIRAPPA